MSTPMSSLWDGERHLMEPDEYFLSSGAALVIVDWEEDEEEDILSPFESKTMIPMLEDTSFDESYYEKFKRARVEQAWGTLCVSMSALCYIIGVQRKQYQEFNHKQNSSRWSFLIEEFVTERL